MTPRTRVLLLIVIAAVAMTVALTTMPQRAHSESLWLISVDINGQWRPYVSRKGYTAQPQSLTVCRLDLLSARIVDPTPKLDCRPVR